MQRVIVSLFCIAFLSACSLFLAPVDENDITTKMSKDGKPIELTPTERANIANKKLGDKCQNAKLDLVDAEAFGNHNQINLVNDRIIQHCKK